MSESRERALVTGASSGIGMEIARVLAAQGCDLVICARRRVELEALAEELTAAHGTTVEVVTADLATRAGVQELIERAGELDILVNNAGFGTSGEHVHLGERGELAMIDLNVRALTQLSHHFGGKMATRRPDRRVAGRILNVASIAAYQPGPSMAVYCATKSYVLSYSRALRFELKPKGVSVTALCPGPVITGFQKSAGMELGIMVKPYLVSASKVAAVAVRAMRRGRREVLPGVLNKPLPLLVRCTPVWLQMRLVNSVLS